MREGSSTLRSTILKQYSIPFLGLKFFDIVHRERKNSLLLALNTQQLRSRALTRTLLVIVGQARLRQYVCKSKS